jgi:hypothetical protein
MAWAASRLDDEHAGAAVRAGMVELLREGGAVADSVIMWWLG